MVIVIENGIGDQNSNPGLGCVSLHTNVLGESHKSICSPHS